MAVRVRRRVERMSTVPALGHGVRTRPSVNPVHLSVLGGRTLNAAVPWPGPRAPHAARLELVRGGRRLSTELAAEPRPDGSFLLTATVPLRHADHPEDKAHGLLLGSGIWRFSVTVTDDGGRESTVDLTAPGFAAVDGPTLPTHPSPVSGAVFRPVRSVDGRAMLKVSAPAHQAELAGFDLRWDRVTVRGRLLAARHPLTDYTVEAVRRGAAGRAVAVTPVWDGDAFTFDLPLVRMTTGGGRGLSVWDVQVRAGRTRLRLARRLSHVRHPKQVFRTPHRIVALQDGSLARVHCYLTPTGSLAVECTAFGTNEDA